MPCLLSSRILSPPCSLSATRQLQLAGILSIKCRAFIFPIAMFQGQHLCKDMIVFCLVGLHLSLRHARNLQRYLRICLRHSACLWRACIAISCIIEKAKGLHIYDVPMPDCKPGPVQILLPKKAALHSIPPLHVYMPNLQKS